jgi:large subunit ribosomal protein L30
MGVGRSPTESRVVMAASLKVTQTRSAIGSKPKQRGTLRALGLGRIGKTNTLPDRPEIRGMLARVPHLVTVEEQD